MQAATDTLEIGSPQQPQQPTPATNAAQDNVEASTSSSHPVRESSTSSSSSSSSSAVLIVASTSSGLLPSTSSSSRDGDPSHLPPYSALGRVGLDITEEDPQPGPSTSAAEFDLEVFDSGSSCSLEDCYANVTTKEKGIGKNKRSKGKRERNYYFFGKSDNLN